MNFFGIIAFVSSMCFSYTVEVTCPVRPKEDIRGPPGIPGRPGKKGEAGPPGKEF